MQAMVALMQDRIWEEIPVRDICDKADIARSTFYLHFAGKAELLDFAFRFLGDEIRSQPKDRSLDTDACFAVLPVVVRMMTTDDRGFLFTRDAASQTTYLARERLRHVIETLLDEELQASARFGSLPKLDLAFCAAGVFGVIEARHLGQIDHDPAQLLAALDTLMAPILARSEAKA